MTKRFRLYRRAKTGRFYIHDSVTGKQDSLHTSDRATAARLLHSRSEAEQQPAVNLQIARAYLAATDPQIGKRTWRYVMDEMVKLKKGETQRRWAVAVKDKAMDTIRDLPMLQTRSEHFLRVLEAGKVSTNVFLRRLHNFAMDMSWLPWPVLAKRQWPKVHFKGKRAITIGKNIRRLSPASRIPSARRFTSWPGTWARRNPTWRIWNRKTLIGSTTSSVSRERKPAPSP
jgi:hypothetical protein